MVNQTILLCLKRRHIPVSIGVLVNLGSEKSVSNCLPVRHLGIHTLARRAQHIMYSHLREEGTFSMGCPVHSDMILLRFALWYMISFACNAHHFS